MNTHELAWAAGFFDGEGHIGASKTRLDIYLRVSQIDRRVLDRFRAAVGLGAVHGPYERHRVNESAVYDYQIQKFEYVQAIVAMLWKYLSPVKRKQAASVLRIARTRPIGLRLAKHWKTCRRGHPRTPENVKIVHYKGYECRRCRQCDLDRATA